MLIPRAKLNPLYKIQVLVVVIWKRKKLRERQSYG